MTSTPVSNAGFTAPIQPPNSPTSNSNRLNNKPSLVDLTDSSNNKDVDADLEKAIQLSLQEVKRPVENFGVSQEDQDVSRALEASLLENQNKRSGMMIDYVDPLNPHDRERHGMVNSYLEKIFFCVCLVCYYTFCKINFSGPWV